MKRQNGKGGLIQVSILAGRKQIVHESINLGGKSPRLSSESKRSTKKEDTTSLVEVMHRHLVLW
jgi:hypothetical protein